MSDTIAVNIKKAARICGTNDKQIRKGIYAREIPVVRLGNSYVIAIDDLREWIKRKKKTI
jgi:rRNA-processing protein FCF1